MVLLDDFHTKPRRFGESHEVLREWEKNFALVSADSAPQIFIRLIGGWFRLCFLTFLFIAGRSFATETMEGKGLGWYSSCSSMPNISLPQQKKIPPHLRLSR